MPFMSRRAPIVEDEFDDDDIELNPSHILPNTGTRGPLLEELHISDDEFEPQAGPASPPSSMGQFRPTPSGASRPESNATMDITPYKSWTCIYPIYIDAKRPYGTGQRRVRREKSLWWPLSKDIAEAANRMGLSTLHEVSKAHPRDWENPGRVRVQWKKDGRLVNASLQTKKQLLEMICLQIQQLKPENKPKPPYNFTPANPEAATQQPKPTSASSKGKQPAQTKSKSPAAPQSQHSGGGRRVPIPPEPLPPLSNRVSQYSPAISTGMLIETVKAGMNASESPAPGAGPTPGGPGGMQKGKRKVVDLYTVIHLGEIEELEIIIRSDQQVYIGDDVICISDSQSLFRGNDRGSGSSWVYDGGPFVRKSLNMGKPVILVTFNFRIGLFGFAASPMIREDNKNAGDEGVGLHDQRKAMEWLHHYIGDFGGDPGNITIFGVSSGGADVLYHLLSADNESRPVFQRAVVQSALLDYNLPDAVNSGWHLSRLLSKLRITTMEQFRAFDADKLASYGHSIRAVDDGVFLRPGWKEIFSKPNDAHARHHYQLKDHIARAHSRARSRSAVRSVSRVRASVAPSPTYPAFVLPPNLQPLIIGDCAGDATNWQDQVSSWNPSGLVRRIKAVCQSLSAASNVMRAYDISLHMTDEEVPDRVMELVDDARIAWPTECAAHNAKRERGGRGVWRYVFDQEGPSKGASHHAADVIYLFDTVPLPASSMTPMTNSPELFCESYDDSDDDSLDYSPGTVLQETEEDEWATCIVDEWSYRRVRDAMQERWISFAHGEAPWKEDKIYVFGPEGETGERSNFIFEGRRRREVWKHALEPIGMQLVQKIGVELSRGPV
ncbi:hypothetical protein H0H93_004141 [Arthromyces matolae]|nr:hypothetical protein H0H93_004141 [Arthromyces matolae]